MIPFSAIIIVPFAELGLPPYLKLFPNAIPNGFRTPVQIKEVKDKLKSTQKNSHKTLHKMINKYLIERGINIRKLDQVEILKEFISKSNKIGSEMEISQTDSETLIKIGEFLGMNLITGTNIISTIFRTFINLPITVNNLIAKLTKSKPHKPKHSIF